MKFDTFQLSHPFGRSSSEEIEDLKKEVQLWKNMYELREMGFSNKDDNFSSLKKCDGEINKAIEILTAKITVGEEKDFYNQRFDQKKSPTSYSQKEQSKQNAYSSPPWNLSIGGEQSKQNTDSSSPLAREVAIGYWENEKGKEDSEALSTKYGMNKSTTRSKGNDFRELSIHERKRMDNMDQSSSSKGNLIHCPMCGYPFRLQQGEDSNEFINRHFTESCKEYRNRNQIISSDDFNRNTDKFNSRKYWNVLGKNDKNTENRVSFKPNLVEERSGSSHQGKRSPESRESLTRPPFTAASLREPEDKRNSSRATRIHNRFSNINRGQQNIAKSEVDLSRYRTPRSNELSPLDTGLREQDKYECPFQCEEYKNRPFDSFGSLLVHINSKHPDEERYKF